MERITFLQWWRCIQYTIRVLIASLCLLIDVYQILKPISVLRCCSFRKWMQNTHHFFRFAKIATNIAETSLTIDGVVFVRRPSLVFSQHFGLLGAFCQVVDPGLFKQMPGSLEISSFQRFCGSKRPDLGSHSSSKSQWLTEEVGLVDAGV